VPFIARWPGSVPAGVVDREHLVSGIDVLPTLCDYAGVEFPEVTGMSLRPLIDNPQAPGRPYLVAELCPDTKDLTMQGRMLRTARYKYVAFSRGRDPEMLFDLREDPGETRNLARDPARRGELERHRASLRSWCVQSRDSFVVAEGE
jgi:arylsulfatase A-like enzyme